MSTALLRLRSVLNQLAFNSKPPSAPTAKRAMSVGRPSLWLLSMIPTVLLSIYLSSIWQTGNDGKITNWVSPSDKSGEFKRGQSAFRNFISKEPGAEFPPEKDRYHLYVSYACPWGTSAARNCRVNS